MEREENPGYFNALIRLLGRLPKEITRTRPVEIADGKCDVPLRWSKGSTQYTLLLHLNIDQELFEGQSTSNQMILSSKSTDPEIYRFVSTMQEVIPFGLVRYDPEQRRATYDTNQLLVEVASSESVLAYHIYAHLQLVELVSQSFSEFREKVADIDQLVVELKARIARADFKLI